MGLRVEPPDETTPVEDGKCVVSEPTLGGGCIDLDAVMKVPEVEEACAIPDDRIEWREQRRTLVPQRATCRLPSNMFAAYYQEVADFLTATLGIKPPEAAISGRVWWPADAYEVQLFERT
jgi:hypothetical protein